MNFIFDNCVTDCDTQVLRKSTVLSFISAENDSIQSLSFKKEWNSNVTLTSYALIRYICNSTSFHRKCNMLCSMSSVTVCDILNTMQYLDMDVLLEDTLSHIISYTSDNKYKKKKLVIALLTRYSL
jgi:hypothetical protein